jgi:hypothetical protein
MPRRIEAVIKAKGGNTRYQHKNWFIEWGTLLNMYKSNKDI